MGIFDKSKPTYEFVSFIMVLVFALLPIITIFGPEKYGVVFKLFSYIEIFTLAVCAVTYVALLIIGTFMYSREVVAERLKTNIKKYLKYFARAKL